MLPLTACSLPFLMFSLKTRLNLISARLQTTTIRGRSQSTAYYLYENFRKKNNLFKVFRQEGGRGSESGAARRKK